MRNKATMGPEPVREAQCMESEGLGFALAPPLLSFDFSLSGEQTFPDCPCPPVLPILRAKQLSEKLVIFLWSCT